MPAFQTSRSAWETFLNTRRWYGAKGAPIESVEPRAWKRGEPLPLWALLRIGLREGDREREKAGPALVQVCSLVERGGGELEEDFEAPAFWAFLREAAGGRTRVEGGELELELSANLDLRGAGEEPGRDSVLEGEMSNTLVRAGPGRLLKVYRGVEVGRHPETEALRMLGGQGFDHAPRLHGVGRFRVRGAGSSTPAVVLALLEDLGDCENVWEIFVREGVKPGTLQALAAELGTVTARLHAAFERAAGVEPAPEAPSIRGELEVLETLSRIRSDLAGEARELADAVLAARSRVEQGLRGLAASELPCIRVHGDYHLGQIVRRRSDGRVVVVDFEGEPALPLALRSVVAPAFRDVADMLRSFSYARFVAGRSPGWERSLRKAFLDAYRAGSPASGSGGDVTFRGALLAFELRKALREVLYELGHRPDWIAVPLRGILENIRSGAD